jgi:hypothetical protein
VCTENQENGHEVRQQDGREQRVAKGGAASEVGRPVAGGPCGRLRRGIPVPKTPEASAEAGRAGSVGGRLAGNMLTISNHSTEVTVPGSALRQSLAGTFQRSPHHVRAGERLCDAGSRDRGKAEPTTATAAKQSSSVLSRFRADLRFRGV